MTEGEARAFVEKLGDGEGVAVRRLERLIEMLRSENEHQNLIAHASFDAIWNRHMADSAQLLAHVPRGTGPWLDLGSGAGFPGIVVACLRPDQRTVLVESRSRRIDWLNRVINELELPHASVAGVRLELLPDEAFSIISARAFAPLSRLIANAARFSTSDTLWLLPKGRSAMQELTELEGWRHKFHVEQSATDPAAGVIVGQLLGKRR